MSDIDVIKYLLDEIEKEEEYNTNYEIAREKAERNAEIKDDNPYRYYKYMPREFDREPRQSIIKANAKKVRQLALKLY